MEAGRLHGRKEHKTRMLGNIVSRLASPTQDGMKYPEMHKKVKVRKHFLEVKKNWVNFILSTQDGMKHPEMQKVRKIA